VIAKHHVRRILRVLQIGILVPEHLVEFYVTPNYELPSQIGMKTRNLANWYEITSATFLAVGLTLILLRLKTRNFHPNSPNYELYRHTTATSGKRADLACGRPRGSARFPGKSCSARSRPLNYYVFPPRALPQTADREFVVDLYCTTNVPQIPYHKLLPQIPYHKLP
jgi:hypothetical protein